MDEEFFLDESEEMLIDIMIQSEEDLFIEDGDELFLDEDIIMEETEFMDFEERSTALVLSQNYNQLMATIDVNQTTSNALVAINTEAIFINNTSNKATAVEQDLYQELVAKVNVNHEAILTDKKRLDEKIIQLATNCISYSLHQKRELDINEYLEESIFSKYPGINGEHQIKVKEDLIVAINQYYKALLNHLRRESYSEISQKRKIVEQNGVSIPALIKNKSYVCIMKEEFETEHYFGTVTLTKNSLFMNNDVILCDRECSNESCKRVLALPNIIYEPMQTELQRVVAPDSVNVRFKTLKYRPPISTLEEIFERNGLTDFFDLHDEVDINIQDAIPSFGSNLGEKYKINSIAFMQRYKSKIELNNVIRESELLDTSIYRLFNKINSDRSLSLAMYDFVKSVIHLFEVAGFLTITYRQHIKNLEYTANNEGVSLSRLNREDSLKFLKEHIELIASVNLVSDSKEPYLEDLGLNEGFIEVLNNAFMYRVVALNGKKAVGLNHIKIYLESEDKKKLEFIDKVTRKHSSYPNFSLSFKMERPQHALNETTFSRVFKISGDSYENVKKFLVNKLITSYFVNLDLFECVVILRLCIEDFMFEGPNVPNYKSLLTSSSEIKFEPDHLIRFLYSNMKYKPTDVDFVVKDDMLLSLKDVDIFTLDVIDVEDLKSSPQFIDYLKEVGLYDLCII